MELLYTVTETRHWLCGNGRKVRRTCDPVGDFDNPRTQGEGYRFKVRGDAVALQKELENQSRWNAGQEAGAPDYKVRTIRSLSLRQRDVLFGLVPRHANRIF